MGGLLSLESHKCRCTRRDQWANLSKFEQASEGLSGKTDGGESETERGEKFFSERRLSRCLALIPLSLPLLCEVFFFFFAFLFFFGGCLLPRYLSLSAGRMGGEARVGLG